MTRVKGGGRRGQGVRKGPRVSPSVQISFWKKEGENATATARFMPPRASLLVMRRAVAPHRAAGGPHHFSGCPSAGGGQCRGTPWPMQ